MFVIDNSVVMAWCFEDESSKYADDALGMLAAEEAVTPSIWPLEVANVILAAERGKRLSRADGAAFLALLRRLPIHVEIESRSRIMGEILSLARDTGLTSYDASYLDLAMRRRLPIATMDKAVRRAARRCRVPIQGL